MTLIVEDGTGLVDAESYISVADATAYHAKRGNAGWANVIDDATRETLLIKATDYMVAAYRNRWAGTRKTPTQALDFPRYNVPIQDSGLVYMSFVSPNVVPNQVRFACAELALRAIDGDLMPDLTQTVIREKVDVIEVEYDRFSPVQKRYSHIDAMLSVFFISANSFTAKIVRS